MNLTERMNAKPEKKAIDPEDAYHAAKECFGDLSEGFVIAGYCRKSHRKFIWKITQGKVYDDALEEIKDPMLTWFDSGNDKTEDQS